MFSPLISNSILCWFNQTHGFYPMNLFSCIVKASWVATYWSTLPYLCSWNYLSQMPNLMYFFSLSNICFFFSIFPLWKLYMFEYGPQILFQPITFHFSFSGCRWLTAVKSPCCGCTSYEGLGCFHFLQWTIKITEDINSDEYFSCEFWFLFMVLPWIMLKQLHSLSLCLVFLIWDSRLEDQNITICANVCLLLVTL